MDILWHGHACFEVRGNGKTIVFDPHDGKSIGIKPPTCRADAVLVSHRQYDHSAVGSVKGNHRDFVCAEGSFDVGSIAVHGYRSRADDDCGAYRGGNVIYTAKMENMSVCHCGGLCETPPDEVTEALAGKTDIMFVPVGEFYTIGLRELAGFLDAVKPKVVVPMLYKTGGMTLPVNPLDDFLEIVCGEPPMRVGGRIELSCDDLPDISGCLIFER